MKKKLTQCVVPHLIQLSDRKLRHEHLDEVRRMQQAGELDRIRNPEDREVVVDVVECKAKQ
jgi:hypothetical protein